MNRKKPEELNAENEVEQREGERKKGRKRGNGKSRKEESIVTNVTETEMREGEGAK